MHEVDGEVKWAAVGRVKAKRFELQKPLVPGETVNGTQVLCHFCKQLQPPTHAHSIRPQGLWVWACADCQIEARRP